MTEPLGDELAVIGVDAAPIGALSSPPLTTVEFNPTAVADVATAALLAELNYPSPPPPQPEMQLELPPVCLAVAVWSVLLLFDASASALFVAV